ncbi:unnamed protein product, partial [marine sediment metagenome]
GKKLACQRYQKLHLLLSLPSEQYIDELKLKLIYTFLPQKEY